MGYDYDAIVVGARVAGASTAMLLARQGHRMLVVDRVEKPADTLSTHALLRTGVLQLARWGVLDRIGRAGTPAIERIMLGFGDERVPFRIKDEHAIAHLYAPRRTLLDSTLLEAAVESGAEFAGGTRVVGMRRDDSGRVHGVEVDGGRSITARYVIGADGFRSRTAELIGAPTHRSHPPTNAINYAYYAGVETPGYWFQFTPGINAGLVPTNDDLTCVFVGRPRRQAAAFRIDPDGVFRKLLEKAGDDLSERVSAATRVTPFRGTSGLPGFVRQAWGPGWALVGDAGYTKDPVSAHGISAALRDAELCARAIDRAICDPSSETTSLDRFQAVRDDLSHRMFHQSKILARYDWSAEEASERMRIISESVRRECDTLAELTEWSSPLLAGTPR